MFKEIVKRVFASAGLEVRRAKDTKNLGNDPFRDMRHILARDERVDQPSIFDVGANAGQTAAIFKKTFPNCRLHCFEPDSTAFPVLVAATAAMHDVKANNLALGARREKRTFAEYQTPDMSSFLEIGDDSWGKIKEQRTIEIDTVDSYCSANGIDRIDILKTDTQGFDLEVIRGAHEMAGRGRIHMVFLEINFIELYKGLPEIDEIYRTLKTMGFELVSFYEFHRLENDPRAAWTDGLFIRSEKRTGATADPD